MTAWTAIFDWDGVIIDSSRQHEQSWQQLAKEEHRQLPPEFFLRSFGMKNHSIIPNLLGWTTDPKEIQRLSDRKETLYREIILKEAIEPLPGVVAFLNRLKKASIPCVIASSTPRKNIESVIDQLKLRAYFQAIVSGEDVVHGKPHPEVFLLAAGQIGMPADRCLVFEDAHVGVQAAQEAKMKVVAVATTHPAETLQDADRIVTRLDELEPAEIAGWF
jgi:beta-phosphoglucomutase family hydrolase